MNYFVQTTEGGPLLNEETVLAFEEKVGIALPVQYREFLMATNGGRPERDLFAINGMEGNSHGRIHVFFGLNDPIESCNLDWNLEFFTGRVRRGLLPIATTEGADKICLSVEGEETGKLFYWDAHPRPGTSNLYFLSNDFGAFASSLRADELSPKILRS